MDKMDYKWDVFLSYRHALPSKEWVHETFFPLFNSYLRNALNRSEDKVVFLDEEGIDPGDAWPYTLQHALAHSRCLVAIWLPDYFHSRWCKRELATMLDREKQHGYRTPINPHGLVLPVKVFDGDYFPTIARQIQPVDYSGFFKVGKGFLNSEQYSHFQEKLVPWIYKVANAVRRAPEWKSEWLNSADSSDYDHLFAENPAPFALPVLS